MFNVFLILLLVALIIYIISKRKDNDTWFDSLLDALLINDMINLIGGLLKGVGSVADNWHGDGGSFSGGGSSGDWDFDFDIDD